MNEFLHLLKKRFPVPKRKKWVTTLNLSRIETNNQTFNKIPDDCVIWLDIRYIPEETDTIVKTIKKLLPEGFKLDIVVKESAQFVDENNQYIKKLQKVDEQITKRKIPLCRAMGSSDARHFTRVNCDAIEFGPIGGGMGSDDEWVSVKSLETYYEILKDFLLSIASLK